MSEMSQLLFTAVYIVHVIAMILSYGMLFAYFQRSNIGNCDELLIHNAVLAGICALPGVLAVPSVILFTEGNKYGIKYWPAERGLKSKWRFVYDDIRWQKETENRAKELSRMMNKRIRNSAIAQGQCDDLWEE